MNNLRGGTREGRKDRERERSEKGERGAE